MSVGFDLLNIHVYYRTVFLELSDVNISIGDIVNSDLIGLGWDLRVYLSNRLPNNG